MMMMILNPLFGFYFILIIAMITMASSNSSFIMWLCLEMNMLAFLPIMSSEAGVAFENTMKYFIIQSCASIIFLFGLIYCLFIGNSFVLLKSIALFFKLGAAPFHGWFISILKSCSIWILFLLSTVQKLLPLLIMVNIMVNPSLLILIVLFTIIVIFFSVPGSVTLNKVLALSSMANLMWLLFSVQNSVKLMVLFMVIYSILLLGIMFSVNMSSNSSFYQMESLDNLSKMLFMFMFMSLGSLPPLLGFMMKLLVLKSLILMMGMFTMMSLVFMSLMILYTYISRFFFYLSMMPSMKLSMKMSKMKYLKLVSLMSVFNFNLFMILVV